mmetsp:Transcript_9866/g.26914  ORF Transcript_9866/g.26914 Transcript_9866/m.26914 type:complete len:111 (+) Transcript_9866:86-418(+)
MPCYKDLAHSHLDTTGFGIGVVRGSHLIRTRCSRQTASAPDLAAWDPSRTVAAARQAEHRNAEVLSRSAQLHLQRSGPPPGLRSSARLEESGFLRTVGGGPLCRHAKGLY